MTSAANVARTHSTFDEQIGVAVHMTVDNAQWRERCWASFRVDVQGTRQRGTRALVALTRASLADGTIYRDAEWMTALDHGRSGTVYMWAQKNIEPPRPLFH